MSTSPGPRQKHPSTYVVRDSSHQEELTRLEGQDRLVTASMGGVFPEQPETINLHRVLDVGCGTGGWLIQVAKEHPAITLLAGADINKTLLDYARAQSVEQQVNDRVEFHLMDALRMLEFPPNYFDLVNQRFGMSYIRTWDWPSLLQKLQYVSRPGGIIRLTEAEIFEGNTPAFTAVYNQLQQAFINAGHFFSSGPDGVTKELSRALHQSGVQNVQTRNYAIEYRAGSPGMPLFFEDVKHMMRVTIPFMQKWTKFPENYETLYQQMLLEMQQPDFVGIWRLLTVWGTAPQGKEKTTSMVQRN